MKVLDVDYHGIVQLLYTVRACHDLYLADTYMKSDFCSNCSIEMTFYEYPLWMKNEDWNEPHQKCSVFIQLMQCAKNKLLTLSPSDVVTHVPPLVHLEQSIFSVELSKNGMFVVVAGGIVVVVVVDVKVRCVFIVGVVVVVAGIVVIIVDVVDVVDVFCGSSIHGVRCVGSDGVVAVLGGTLLLSTETPDVVSVPSSGPCGPAL